MSDIDDRLKATQESIVASEQRLQRAWGTLTHSARPDVQVGRKVASRPGPWWFGAFAVGLTLGLLHGAKRRLPY